MSWGRAVGRWGGRVADRGVHKQSQGQAGAGKGGEPTRQDNRKGQKCDNMAEGTCIVVRHVHTGVVNRLCVEQVWHYGCWCGSVCAGARSGQGGAGRRKVALE